MAELIQIESDIHKELSFEAGTIRSVTGNGSSVQASMNRKSPCLEVRRNAVIALTNLTFGNAPIKSFLCSFPDFVKIMVAQLGMSNFLFKLSTLDGL